MLSKIFQLILPLHLFKSSVVVGGVAAAGIGAAGSMMAAKTAAKGQEAAAKSANSPWSASQPYIINGFEKASPALDDALAMGAYSGPRVAGLNGYQTQGADQTAAWANSNGLDTANTLYGAGKTMTGAGTQFGANGQTLFDQAGTNQTGNFLNTANAYANNPYVDGLVDANSRDITRNLNENQLPSLALGAAGSGNTNSTRTGVSEAIAQRGAADRLADVSNNIRSSFFSKGLDMAQNQYNTQQGQALQANGQLGTAFGMGTNALTQGQQANGNNFDQTQAAGGVFQGQEQQQLTADQQAWAEKQNVPLDLLGKYMSVINGKFGGQAINPVGPSVGAAGIQGALGGAAGAAGLYGKLGGFDQGPAWGSGSSSGYDFNGGGANATTPTVQSGGTGDYSFGMSAPGYGSFQ